MRDYLEFEKPIREIEERLEKLLVLHINGPRHLPLRTAWILHAHVDDRHRLPIRSDITAVELESVDHKLLLSHSIASSISRFLVSDSAMDASSSAISLNARSFSSSSI